MAPTNAAARPLAASVTAVAALVGLVACAPAAGLGADPTAPPAEFGHVHALGVDTGTGRAYAATHHGVWLLPTGGLPDSFPGGGHTGPPTRMEGPARDTMAFTIAEPGLLLASGHPDPAEEFDLEHPNLGLIASTDGAETWVPVSLRGDVDFHDLATVALPGGEMRVYGHDSADLSLRISDDGGVTWRDAATVEARDLAADPGDPDRLYATTADGLVRSDDAGATFASVDGAPPLYLVEATAPGELVGIDVDGRIQSFDGRRWTAHGAVQGVPEAFAYVAGVTPWLLVADERGIVASDDLGETATVLVPAAG